MAYMLSGIMIASVTAASHNFASNISQARAGRRNNISESMLSMQNFGFTLHPAVKTKRHFPLAPALFRPAV
jgi:hypothetical protein